MRTIDDSTIYRSCKINQKDTFKKELEVDITSVAKWLFETNLVFKTGKTNIYYLQKKMSVWHELNDEHINIYCTDIKLEERANGNCLV